MKFNQSLLAILSILLINLPFTTKASLGPGSSGGGNELIADFVKNAHALLTRVHFSAADQKLLEKALKTSKIVTTDLLTDIDNLPVSNQRNLIAYSGPGLIELKENRDGSGDSWETAISEHRPLAQMIVHELFRASGVVDKTGRSPDDTFQLSIGQYHLNRLDSLGFPLKSVPDIAYWQCQCFVSISEGAPVAGSNLVGPFTLDGAEATMSNRCQNGFAISGAVARCLKVVGDPGR